MNPEGKILSSASGPGTNHYLIGMDECRRRIADLVNKAKEKAGIPLDTPILALVSGSFIYNFQTINTQLIKKYLIVKRRMCVRLSVIMRAQ